MSIHAQLFGSILTDQVHPDLDTNFPFIPLMTPGIPLPGPNFARQAQRLDPANQAPIEGKGSAAKLVGGNSSRYLHYLYRVICGVMTRKTSTEDRVVPMLW